MKTPYSERLEQLLRGSTITAGGFYGSDTRTLEQIIAYDDATIEKLGKNCGEIAAKMAEITSLATKTLGGWVDIDGDKKARVEEVKGSIICPWPHPGRYDKRVTVLRCEDVEIVWSDLNVHLISEHGFFEGKGAAFRIEPAELVKLLW